ncbi:MAG: RNA 2',3'-cyclic phosphodiesterase [Propionibacteriaceae bacterium]|nr:RNA 2',3'-cyclic phosphodiesterase [Propionibacteriaceae bacterium]
MRCFIAVIPPVDVVADIVAFLEPRHAAQPTWRWSRPEVFHLTLAFMADYPAARAEELAAALDDWASRQTPLELRIQGAGAFGGPERAKVLYLAVPGEPAQVLGAWSRHLRALVSRHGGSPDGAAFTPHLTVARASRGQAAGRLLQALDTYTSPEFTINEVVLVESHLANRTHEVLHWAALRGEPRAAT